MGRVIAETRIDRESNYLYFVDKIGNVIKVRIKRAGKKTSKKQQVVAKVGIKRKVGYLYFIDKKGNVCEAKMQRGGKKRKKKRTSH